MKNKNKNQNSATKIQNNFGYYLARAINTSKPVTIIKHKRPVAVIVGMPKWERLIKAAKASKK